MEAVQQKIAGLLEQLIGLKVSSIGAPTLERVLNTRMTATGINDVKGYFDKLTCSRLELRKLVEEVVVPETWFFRDQEPFKYLSSYIRESGKDLNLDIFRILSLPCSTGEEPYSIAMTMLESGLAPTSFYIDAVDVSERVLERARQGVYGENSFRTRDLSFRDKYFVRKGNRFELKKVVHDKVRFLQGNLLSREFMESLGRYDVVFCRNVLIYFNEEAQQQVIDSIYQLLIPKGILFTGHAEAGLFHDGRFDSIPHARAFAFHRRNPVAVGSGKRSGMGAGLTSLSTGSTGTPFHKRRSRPPVNKRPPLPKADQVGDFEQVRRAADQGRLDEAARQCEENLDRQGPDVCWYYLLGVIRDSQGRVDEAIKLLRKALYMDPAHVDSLIHLSLLAERAGDMEGAANYKRRVERLKARG